MSQAATSFQAVTWTFHGRVLPDMPAISLQIPVQLVTSTAIKYELAGRIHNSKLLAVVKQLGPVDVFTLRNMVASSIQSFVDFAGLRAGAGLDIDLISAQADDGSWQFFDAFIPALQVTGAFELQSNEIAAVGVNVQLQIALADFREAIRVPVQTGFFCYRAIEAIMQAFREVDDLSEKQAWAKLRESLSVPREALDEVKLHADWARHGRSGAVTDAERLMLLSRTRTIIETFIRSLVD